MSYLKDFFEPIPEKNPNKSRFNRSHEYKTQLQPGYLVPVLTEPTMPNDYYEINSEFMFRFSSLYFPIMHKMTMRAAYYYIPNRILWTDQGATNSGWAKWITEMHEQSHPVVTANMEYTTTGISNQVMGYMGVPLIEKAAWNGGVGVSAEVENLNAFPLSAYLKIWDEYYRVPQLEDEKWFPLSAGDNTAAFQTAFETVTKYYKVISAKWEKDYFTSALPTPQIGDAIQIPLIADDNGDGILDYPTKWRELSTGNAVGAGVLGTAADGSTNADELGLQIPSGLDIQETAATIRQLRLAEVLQSYYERIMKVGQRYRDYIKGLFGNDPEPAVIDRPVLIGQRFGRVQVADVMVQADTVYDAATSKYRKTGDYTGQANLYSNENDKIKYHCREHGWIMCILEINPNTSYGQGIERFWRYNVQTDYPLDMFAGIGDQEILKEELLYLPVTAEEEKNFETYGYIPRFSEMRYKINMHTMALGFNNGLSQHLGRIYPNYTGNPYSNFMEIQSFHTNSAPEYTSGTRVTDVFRVLPTTEGVQEPAEQTVYAHIFHTMYVERNLPMFSTPKLG